MAISESQKGRVIEQLVGATLILQSNGALRASLPLVDDEGVDLVVGNRTNDKTLLLQIKAGLPVYVFDSTFKGKSDMWVPFRLLLTDAAAAILKALK